MPHSLPEEESSTLVGGAFIGGELHVVGVKAFLRALAARPASNHEVILRELGARPLVSREELIDALYGLDPDGGAEYADSALLVEIWLLRRRGHPVVNHHGRGYSLARYTAEV